MSIDMDKKTNRSDLLKLKKAIKAFCIVGGVAYIIMCGSTYLGLFGFSLSPSFKDKNELCGFLYQNISRAIACGVTAGATVYLSGKRSKRVRPSIDIESNEGRNVEPPDQPGIESREPTKAPEVP